METHRAKPIASTARPAAFKQSHKQQTTQDSELFLPSHRNSIDLTPASIASLGRLVGNHALQRMLKNQLASTTTLHTAPGMATIQRVKRDVVKAELSKRTNAGGWASLEEAVEFIFSSGVEDMTPEELDEMLNGWGYEKAEDGFVAEVQKEARKEEPKERKEKAKEKVEAAVSLPLEEAPEEIPDDVDTSTEAPPELSGRMSLASFHQSVPVRPGNPMNYGSLVGTFSPPAAASPRGSTFTTPRINRVQLVLQKFNTWRGDAKRHGGANAWGLTRNQLDEIRGAVPPSFLCIEGEGTGVYRARMQLKIIHPHNMVGDKKATFHISYQR